MPRLTMLVDITASASRPGTRKSGGLAATAPKKTISTTGTTIVIRRLSVRRNVRINSTRIWAARAFMAALQSDRARRREAQAGHNGYRGSAPDRACAADDRSPVDRRRGDGTGAVVRGYRPRGGRISIR